MQGQEQGWRQQQGGEHREPQSNWLTLYALTVALEVPAMLARYVPGLIVASVVIHANGEGGNAQEWAKLAAVGPVVWSALALVTPRGGGWWWRQRQGGRPPSAREREAYEQAMRQVQSRTNTPVPTPESWFVLEEQRCEAAVYGNTLMLSSGALRLQNGQLPALLAHELGHLRGMDAKLTVAVNRLVLKPLKLVATPDPNERQPQSPARQLAEMDRRARKTVATVGLTRWTLAQAMTLMRGGLGLRLTGPAWGAVWQKQEYEADSWAASIGWAPELAEFLQSHVLELDHPIPLGIFSNQGRPPTELRIDKLRQSPQTPPASTPETGPAWIEGEPA